MAEETHHTSPNSDPATACRAYQAFTETVLTWHHSVSFPALERELCACGHKPAECRYQILARRLGLRA
jgi:hypothetical protein